MNLLFSMFILHEFKVQSVLSCVCFFLQPCVVPLHLTSRLLCTRGQTCITICQHTCLLRLCNLTLKAINLILWFFGAEGEKKMLIYGLRQWLCCRALLNDNSLPRSGLPWYCQRRGEVHIIFLMRVLRFAHLQTCEHMLFTSSPED